MIGTSIQVQRKQIMPDGSVVILDVFQNTYRTTFIDDSTRLATVQNGDVVVADTEIAGSGMCYNITKVRDIKYHKSY
ncbi:MAG: hypothetical protein IJM79_01695 [Erysipelotrichaceae bacterium]|nr:hypothetical protein [Erysipelotrichaceae bacterium]